MRKFFCAFLLICSFSLFAQENNAEPAEPSAPVENPSVSDGSSPVVGNGSSENEPEKDLSQDYLAKSAAPVNAVAWTRDGKYFATSWNNSVILWNADSNTIAAIYSNSVSENSNPLANIISLQFTSDGRYMLSVRDDNTALIHSVGTNSDSTLITGTGNSIPDAVFAGDYKILLPLDGKNLYESLRLPESGQFKVEEKLDFADGIWGLSSNPAGKRVLVTSESGAVRVVDTTSWEVLAEFECYTLTRIKPKFAEDSVHFLSAKDQNTLVVTSSNDASDFLTVEEPAGFSFTAEFSADSTKIVAGVDSGCVKIYDIASGLEENSFKLMYGDSAKSLAFSPDGKYVIIGTEQGYIYRWVLSGEEFVPEDERPQENKLENSLTLSVGYGRLGTNYYLGNAIFEAGYRNYFRTPFYWGAVGSLGAGVPGSEFPYTYYEGGEQLSAPFLYTLASGGLIGLVYYNKEFDFHVFSEAGAGWNVRMMFDNSLKYPHHGKPYFGGYGELVVGVQWKWARLWGGVQYDSNLHWLMKAHIGVAMPTKSFRRTKSAKKIQQE